MLPFILVPAGIAAVVWGIKVLFEDEHETLDRLLHDVSGRRVAIVGERETGKTTLNNYIHSGSVTLDYDATTFPEQMRGRRFKIGDLKLKAKKTRDVSGSDDRYGDWKQEIHKADATLYLCRLDRLLDGDAKTIERTQQDARYIAEVQNGSKVFLVGTFADKVPGWLHAVQVKDQAAFEDELRERREFRRIVGMLGGFSSVDVVIGTLVMDPYSDPVRYGAPEGCESVVSSVFRELYQ